MWWCIRNKCVKYRWCILMISAVKYSDYLRSCIRAYFIYFCGDDNETIQNKCSVACKISHIEITSKQNCEGKETIQEPCDRTAFQLKRLVTTRNLKNIRYSRDTVTGSRVNDSNWVRRINFGLVCNGVVRSTLQTMCKALNHILVNIENNWRVFNNIGKELLWAVSVHIKWDHS